MKKICLIDGSGYIFRAFYGLPPMTNPNGVPVNAVYGFTNMFVKLMQEINAEYNLVLFDAKRKNYRNDIYPEYKANRSDAPEDLVPQFPLIRDAVNALNVPQLEMEGYEADDLIATIAKEGKEKGFEVIIVSADKDLMQLVSDNVKLFDPMKNKYMGEEEVEAKFGVKPNKVIDVQALSGDSVDNVPGVPGIGPKTAAQLINEYGDLETLLERAGEIKQNKRRENLIEFADDARVSLELVTLKDDIELASDIEDYKNRKPVPEDLKAFIELHNFNGLRARLEKYLLNALGGAEFFETKKIEKEYELITEEKQLDSWVKRITEKGIVAFDTETTGLDPLQNKLVGISLSVEEGKACYIPISHFGAGENSTEENSSGGFDLFSVADDKNKDIPKQISKEIVLAKLMPIFTSKSIMKIGHNIKFDILVMQNAYGKDIDISPIDDTMVLSYVLDGTEHSHAMDELATHFLDYQTIKFEDVCGKGKSQITFDKVELENALDYAAEDADITLRLYNLFKPRLLKENKASIYEYYDRPLISVLAKMEKNGIIVDKEKLAKLSVEFKEKLKGFEKEVFELAGEEFNIASPKQIGEILFDKLELKGKKTKTGAWQTSAAVLEKLAEEGSEICSKILEWRSFAKLISTYTDALIEQINQNTKRVHTNYTQTVVNTGRLSSNNPNLQNIPIRSEMGKKIRECFIAKENHKLIAIDYSQAELRLMAHCANVKLLKQAFANGEDIHSSTAAQIFGVELKDVDSLMRRKAKAINFGIIYGISQYGLAKQIDVTPFEAKEYIDAYFEKFPEIKTYMEETKEFATKHGYVETPFGRKCIISGINDKNKMIVSIAQRAAINAPIQGGSADMLKLVMVKLNKILEKYKTKMLLQVHDELIFEVPNDEVDEVSKMIKNEMENIVDLSVDFVADVEIGDNWNLK